MLNNCRGDVVFAFAVARVDPRRDLITMGVMAVVIEFGGHSLQLLGDRAMYWAATRTLIVADVHVGKAATFRALGVPVPGGITAKDLARLSDLLRVTGAERLLILGDFLHAREAHAANAQLLAWRGQHADLRIDLVIGNHDRRAGATDAGLGIRELASPHEELGLQFVHDPAEARGGPTLAGHLHPQAWLADFDGSGAKVPCFVVETSLLVMPAFGSFTGGVRIAHRPHRRLFIAAAGRVVELKPTLHRTASRNTPRPRRR